MSEEMKIEENTLDETQPCLDENAVCHNYDHPPTCIDEDTSVPEAVLPVLQESDPVEESVRMKLFLFTERVIKEISKNLTFEAGDFFYGIFITDKDNAIVKSDLGRLEGVYSSTGQYMSFLKGINMLKELNITNVKTYVKDKRFTKRLMQDSNYYKIRENKSLVEEIKAKIKDMKIKFVPIGKTLFKKNTKLASGVKEIWMKHIEDF